MLVWMSAYSNRVLQYTKGCPSGSLAFESVFILLSNSGQKGFVEQDGRPLSSI